MALNFSPAYVAAAHERLRFTPLWLSIIFAPWIKRWRILRLRLANKRVHSANAICSIGPAFDAGGEHYRAHGWAFVDPMLHSDFHAEIIRNWPKKQYLEPPREVEKSYDTGFRWISGDAPDFHYSDPCGQYPTFVNFLQYLRSPEFCARVQQLNGAAEEMMLYSFILTDAGPGAEVIPHHDSNKFDPRAKNFLNMIFFITATGGGNSGGLTLSRDNEIKDIIFEPTKLVNTCLVYNIIDDFYHGFPPIAPGKFRWVITAQYCQKDYVEPHDTSAKM